MVNATLREEQGSGQRGPGFPVGPAQGALRAHAHPLPRMATILLGFSRA